MKKISTLFTFILLQTTILFAGNENDTLLKQKQCFYDAKAELENMLSEKTPLDYERAVFITENAYWSNQVSYQIFKNNIDFHVNNIKAIAESSRNEQTQNFKPTLLETEEQKREKYNKLLYNYAIYTYLTDTVYIIKNDALLYHTPCKYSTSDPLGTINWENSQVFSLLDAYNKTGNCYAQTSFYKILSERLKTDADIGIAPGHVYITHKGEKDIHYNVELASRSFPGAGSIMTLTYTPVDAVRNGIAMRTLNLKQSVALCLVYLAKGYEHKFKTKTDDFIYQCAETTLKYDSLSLNAMLLKAEVLEENIVNKKKSIAQLQKDNEFKAYQSLIVSLFEKGYREMPLDMKNLIVNRLQKDSVALVLTNHTPKAFQTINPKDDRYATLSWGMFDEVHEPKLIEQYGRALLNTNTKKITKFVTVDTLYNKYPIDPVVSAWQIDPLASKFPWQSPYCAFDNDPISKIDPDGRAAGWYDDNGEAKYDPKINSQKDVYNAGKTGKYYGDKGTEYAPDGTVNILNQDGTIDKGITTLPEVKIKGLRGSGAVVDAMQKSMSQGYDPNWLPDFNRCVVGALNYIQLQLNVVTFASAAGDLMAGAGTAKGGQTIIGEGMKRVSMEAAKRPGSVILNNMPKFTGTADQVTSQMMTYNRQWILQQMRSGRPILDIGLDATRANPSIFYQMEQNMMKNYLKLHPNAFQIIKP